MNTSWKREKPSENRTRESIEIILGHNSQLLEFLFDPASPRIRKRAGILRDDLWSFSDEDQLLIRAALDLWSGSGHLQLWEMVETWDKKHWVSFIAGVCRMVGVESEVVNKLRCP